MWADTVRFHVVNTGKERIDLTDVFEKQAEITGEIAFKKGRKEMVGELGLHCYIWYDEDNKKHICIDMESWQAKLKDWNISA